MIGESSLPGLHMAVFRLYFLWRREGGRENKDKLSGVSSYKGTNSIRSGPYPYNLFYPNYFCKGPISKYIGGLGFQCMTLETQFNS